VVEGEWWHFRHVTDAWAPVSLYGVTEWLKAAGRHALVLWHEAQFEPKWLSWDAGRPWHDEHSVEVAAGGGVVWHRSQLTPAWAPVSLNDAALWLNDAADQVVAVWHASQLVPRAPWCLSCDAWHPAQLVGVPANLAVWWHFTQSTLACACVSANPVLAWSNVACFQSDGL
jgi:hypothetical protein